jgi:hypothetical protein
MLEGKEMEVLADPHALDNMKIEDLPEPTQYKGESDMPTVSTYLRRKQASGKTFHAREIYLETYEWLKGFGCEKIVGRRLIEQYAVCVARWIACDEYISEKGYLATHPTTGAAIKTPFVEMSQSYMKQANQVWYQMYQIVQANSSETVGGFIQAGDTMEILLTSGRPKTG